MNYRELKVGSETAHGKIARIIAASDDFIVFRNDLGEGKILSNRVDDVYRKSHALAIKISAEGGQKFHGVYQDNLNELTAACMGRAMQKGITIDEVEQQFEPLRNYIDSTPPIKRLLGQGEVYGHKVFIDNDGNLGWTCKQFDDDHLTGQLAKLDRLSRLAKSQMARWFRGDVVASLAAAVLFIFSTKNTKDREHAVDEATRHVTRKVQEYHHASYVLILLFFVALISLVTMRWGVLDGLLDWQLAIIGGTVGAAVSCLQRTKTAEFELTQSRTNVLVQAMSYARK